MLARELFAVGLSICNMVTRNRYGENNVYAAGLVLILLVLSMESIMYVNHKAKANLFMRIKVIALQEEQLKNLLDTVPDKVLIMSKTSEASAPKSLYSNRQMNELFGCDVVYSDKLYRSQKSRKQVSKKEAPTRQKIFKECSFMGNELAIVPSAAVGAGLSVRSGDDSS